MENIIEINHLTKTFKDVVAVKDLSLKVKKGEFFAFLGINGAGKSTTISIICGELQKDSGEVIVCGQNIDSGMQDIKGRLGVVYQNNALDAVLTVYENLKSRALLYGMSKHDFENKLKALSKMLDLEDILNRTYKKLSGGQKRRVDIARALINDPEILILDEPTTGLDPQTRKLVWQVIHDLRKTKGLTVFLTTHYMEEVVDADYVVILNKGEIVASGSPIDLKNQYTGDFISLYNIKEEDVKLLNLNYSIIPDGFRIEVKDTEEATKLILLHPELFKDYEIIKGKMDDVFLNATGIKLGGE